MISWLSRKRYRIQASEQEWVELVRNQQLTTLAMAQLALRISFDPELVTPELQKELVQVISEVEDRMAVLSEHIV